MDKLEPWAVFQIGSQDSADIDLCNLALTTVLVFPELPPKAECMKICDIDLNQGENRNAIVIKDGSVVPGF